MISKGNHAADDYTLIAADQLLPSNGANPEGISRLEVRIMQNQVAMVLKPVFEHAVDAQKTALALNPADLTIAVDIAEAAIAAAKMIIALAKSSFWEKVTNEAEWLNAAVSVIGTHLMTAVHIENLLHADTHMDVPEAKSYKIKFQGAN